MMKVVLAISLLVYCFEAQANQFSSLTCDEQANENDSRPMYSERAENGDVSWVIPHTLSCKFIRAFQCQYIIKESVKTFNDIASKMTKEYPNNLQLLVAQKTKAKKVNINVEQNYRELTKQHKILLNSINGFVQEQSNQVSKIKSFQDLNSFVKTVNSRVSSFRKDLRKPALADEYFLEYLNFQSTVLTGLMSEVESLKNEPECFTEYSMKSQIETTFDTIKPFIQSVVDMGDAIRQASQKRSLYLDIVHYGLTKKAQQRYLSFTDTTYAELIATYGDVLKVEELTFSVGDWWIEARNQGIANAAYLYTLQYHEPLFQLRRLKADLLQYRNEINTASVASNLKQPLLDSLKVKERTLNRLIDSLETKGWEGVFSEQKRMANARLNYLDKYREGCESAIDGFNSIADSVTDAASFRNAERAYLIVYSKCQKK